MKNSILEYRGYHTSIEFDAATFTLRGKIEGIDDYVDFESDNLAGIEKEFHDAVDEYLEFCKEVGKDPDKEYKGTFNVRIQPELHKKLAVLAYKNGESLNTTVEKAIQSYVLEETVTKTQLQQTIKNMSEVLTTYIYNSQQTSQIDIESNIIPYESFGMNNINMVYQEKRLS